MIGKNHLDYVAEIAALERYVAGVKFAVIIDENDHKKYKSGKFMIQQQTRY